MNKLEPEKAANEIRKGIVTAVHSAKAGHVADGNDFEQLKDAFDEAKETKGMPTAIIMRTVKGKGVSYMENQIGWHGKAPNDEEFAAAMSELEKAGEALCQK